MFAIKIIVIHCRKSLHVRMRVCNYGNGLHAVFDLVFWLHNFLIWKTADAKSCLQCVEMYLYVFDSSPVRVKSWLFCNSKHRCVFLRESVSHKERKSAFECSRKFGWWESQQLALFMVETILSPWLIPEAQNLVEKPKLLYTTCGSGQTITTAGFRADLGNFLAVANSRSRGPEGRLFSGEGTLRCTVVATAAIIAVLIIGCLRTARLL